MTFNYVMGIILIANGICTLALSRKKEAKNKQLLLILSAITIVCGLFSIILNLI